MDESIGWGCSSGKENHNFIWGIVTMIEKCMNIDFHALHHLTMERGSYGYACIVSAREASLCIIAN